MNGFPVRPPASAYDVVVVGGGAGGCVVARRLAEDPQTQVLLIEAGPPDHDPAIADIRHWTGLLRGPYDWDYDYAPTPHVNNRIIPIARGRVLGGSSSINAVTWYRGHRSDYDAWANAGAEGWGWDAVLPYFRRAEDWEGGATPWRGAGGPMRIERPRDPHPIALAMLEGAAQLGLPVLDDHNGPDNAGAALTNLNARSGRRWSTVDGYLRPAAEWPNLTVLTGSPAIDLAFEGRRCVGIRHLVDGVATQTRAQREVVLALGTFDTPRLLMLSGIGDPAELARLGIPVRTALPGVGQNLQDHPLLMGMNFRARMPLGPVRDNAGGSMMNWRSRADLIAPDLHAFVVQGPHAGPEIAAAYDLSGDVFAVSPGLVGSHSVGYVRLHDAAPGGRLEIQPNFLAEPEDLDALVAAVETIADLTATPAYRALIEAPAAPNRRLSRAERVAFVRDSVGTFFHPVGTCAMGAGEAAVVDPWLRVRGVDGLRIADASVMPIIPTCNTLAPVVMIAERAAEFIRQGR
jgi:choline dehydrogenase